MPKSVRTVRFGDEEIIRIERFLAQNPVFDFSRLVRLAIDQFLENPDIKIRPVRRVQRKSQKEL